MSYASSDTRRYFEVCGPKRLNTYERPWLPDTIGCHAATALFYGHNEPVTFQIQRVRANGTHMQRRQPVIVVTTSYAGFWTYTETKAKRPYDLSATEYLVIQQIAEAADKHYRALCEMYPEKNPNKDVA